MAFLVRVMQWLEMWKESRLKKKKKKVTLQLKAMERQILKRDARERREIARVFNNRYCMAERYDRSSNNPIPGYGDGGFLFNQMLEGYRWMCPTCNAIHPPVENSFTHGLIYPSCCSHPKGGRIETLDSEIGNLKRPIGWCGPDGLYLKMRRNQVEPSVDHEEWNHVSHGPTK